MIHEGKRVSLPGDTGRYLVKLLVIQQIQHNGLESVSVSIRNLIFIQD